MAVTAGQKSDHITRVRSAATKLLTALTEYVSERRMYDGLGFSGGALVDGDFLGANASLTKAEFANAIASLDAVNAFVAGNNHDDVLYVVRS